MWEGFAAGCAIVTSWGVAKCTLFAREYERERVEWLLMRHGVNRQNLEVALRTVARFRRTVTPLWFIACGASWGLLIGLLRHQT